MRAKGITYDTGFIHGPHISHDPFDEAVVRRELRVIRDDLHCDAVRVTGGDPGRLEKAAAIAAELGLEVWFSPFVCDLTEVEMLDLLADCAERAERIRRTQAGVEVVFVTGGELTLLNHGFLPGDSIEQRLELLNDPQRLRQAMGEARERLNKFLAMALTAVRERFSGKVTYAAIHPLEGVDWEPFDFVSIDLYRTAEHAEQFEAGVRHLAAKGKPLAITEFGSATYKGASAKGARAAEIVEWDGYAPKRLDGEYVRDEAEQAACVGELLEIFDRAGVDSTFVFTFANFDLPHRPDGDPRDDLDLASYGIVKVREDRTWEPKQAFQAVAGRYYPPRPTAG
jgi:hypothetical protein